MQVSRFRGSEVSGTQKTQKTRENRELICRFADVLAAFLNAQNLVMSKSTSDILPQDLQTTLQDLIFFPNTSVVYLVTS